MSTVFAHPLAGVLSAYGMGLADQTAMREMTIERPLANEDLPALSGSLQTLAAQAAASLKEQGVARDRIRLVQRAHLKYEGTDTALAVAFGDVASMREQFDAAYRQRFSFLMPDRRLDRRDAVGRSDWYRRGRGGRSC